VFKGGLFKQGSTHEISLWDGSLARLTVKQGGNVGIGTTAPNAILQVSGSMIVSVMGMTTPTLYVGTNGSYRYKRSICHARLRVPHTESWPRPRSPRGCPRKSRVAAPA
jgi:hypothetical protein